MIAPKFKMGDYICDKKKPQIEAIYQVIEIRGMNYITKCLGEVQRLYIPNADKNYKKIKGRP